MMKRIKGDHFIYFVASVAILFCCLTLSNLGLVMTMVMPTREQEKQSLALTMEKQNLVLLHCTTTPTY